MTTWKDGSNYGHLCQEITDEDNERIICVVWTRQFSLGSRNVEPYPQGEANFRLILAAPETARALKEIAHGAIVSPDQPPEKIAEQVLRVLQLVQEDSVRSLEFIGEQEKQAKQMLEALETIRDKADDMMEIRDGSVDWTDWQPVRSAANAAIAAAKGNNDETELV